MSQQYKPWDCHCHLELSAFDKDREEVIQRAREKLENVVISPIDSEKYESTLDLAKESQGFLLVSLGFTPPRNPQIDYETALSLVNHLAKNGNVRAIGEVGLDYHWVKDKETRAFQKEVFQQFIDMSKKFNLPLIIHSRKAEEDCIDIVSQNEVERVYFHCFDGDEKQVKRLIEHEKWVVGIPTNVTWRRKTQNLCSMFPLERLLTETDSPYLHPIQNFKGPRQRNEPANITDYAIQEIANIKEKPINHIIQMTTKAARDFYKREKR
ncbi:MAG: TatD family hydrolase [Candidatus Ranarchaeia archaeon]|jgi:TatD DNase family protein